MTEKSPKLNTLVFNSFYLILSQQHFWSLCLEIKPIKIHQRTRSPKWIVLIVNDVIRLQTLWQFEKLICKYDQDIGFSRKRLEERKTKIIRKISTITIIEISSVTIGSPEKSDILLCFPWSWMFSPKREKK